MITIVHGQTVGGKPLAIVMRQTAKRPRCHDAPKTIAAYAIGNVPPNYPVPAIQNEWESNIPLFRYWGFSASERKQADGYLASFAYQLAWDVMRPYNHD